jgi:hypothetical protein
MWEWIKHLDRLLRGEATSLPQLQSGTINFPLVGLSIIIIILGAIYGACMGLFAITGSGNGAAMQIPASMIKVPALFFLTLVVTFPSLYVFNALVGSRLTFASTLRLLIGSLAIMLAVLASLGPIVAFFSISTTSYQFMKLLNVIVYTISGFLGLAFLLQTLHRISIAQAPANLTKTPENAGALDRISAHVLGPHVKTVFRIWLVVFGMVGAQMAWVLRPFIGRPDIAFTWFRPRESNFFQALFDQILSFFHGR